MQPNQPVIERTTGRTVEINKVLKNTYLLLSATFIFSAIMATISTLMYMPPMTYLICIGIAFLMIWFVLPKTANSSSGLITVFAITGLMGFAIGPLLNAYLALSNGSQIIGTALGGTGIIFFALSGYALMTKKDFSFMGGFLLVGLMIAIVASLANIFLQISGLSLAISAVIILIMSGFILYDTSQMIHRPESANYILMTVSLFLSMFNIFINLLHLLGFANDD
ncbi:Bax inhibitor-1/YccA family protein [Aliikangiella marina]|uniref:Bax inhibitor-1/YccA family protein n=1 Tax=Aliikangiella marina TaxID=1712262 RepID=A0A545THH3_9GAMM|nr:Bax inhibitor-1/YccA family protein [Aliikangiella marina]TQV76636.1 Bax inhibitor-1/YccA family protein [Aliikangiella marina]